MANTKYLFFSGKGGVGKTTSACATALYHALSGRRTLIVTTDPASNLADVFEQEIGHRITSIYGVANLSAMEIDPDAATREFSEAIIGPMRGVMPDSVIAVIEEQFSSPCTTEIAAFDRFTDFMQESDYDVIVFDTAPTGHTLRLLQLPDEWSRHLTDIAATGGQTCIGPVQNIAASREKYAKAMSLLADPIKTEFSLVVRPDHTSITEAKRSASELESLGIRNFQVIANGILPEECHNVPAFASVWKTQERHLAELPASLPFSTKRIVLRSTDLGGVAALADFAVDLCGLHPNLVPIVKRCQRPPESLERVKFVYPYEVLKPAAEKTRLLLFGGKGGVGKSTMACITAYYMAWAGFKTLLLTTDPAAHIGIILGCDVDHTIKPVATMPNLWATRIDQKEATRAYKEKILGQARLQFQSHTLKAMEEELNSPCTEEMATFDCFADFVSGSQFDVVVFDTAPTGHTMRLLELPFDYAKQVEMMVGSGEGSVIKAETRKRFDTLIRRLKDPDMTLFTLILYPEETPMIEAHRAFLDLQAAGINVGLVIANQLLHELPDAGAFYESRRQMQQQYLAETAKLFPCPIAAMPLLTKEIIGMEPLKAAVRAFFACGAETHCDA